MNNSRRAKQRVIAFRFPFVINSSDYFDLRCFEANFSKL